MSKLSEISDWLQENLPRLVAEHGVPGATAAEDVPPPCCEVQFVEGVPTDRCLPGLEGPAGLPLVAEALKERGRPDDDIALVLGQNLLDLFRSELTRGSAS